MNRADYDRYLSAFNAKDYDGVADFYVEPMAMDFFGVSIRSRADLKRFYGFLHSYVHESVTVQNFAASDTLTAVDAIVRIEAYRDLDAETLAANGCAAFLPVKAGEVQELRQFIFYTIADGKIAKVECALV
jgi:SnoaL-like domain